MSLIAQGASEITDEFRRSVCALSEESEHHFEIGGVTRTVWPQQTDELRAVIESGVGNQDSTVPHRQRTPACAAPVVRTRERNETDRSVDVVRGSIRSTIRGRPRHSLEIASIHPISVSVYNSANAAHVRHPGDITPLSRSDR